MFADTEMLERLKEYLVSEETTSFIGNMFTERCRSFMSMINVEKMGEARLRSMYLFPPPKPLYDTLSSPCNVSSDGQLLGTAPDTVHTPQDRAVDLSIGRDDSENSGP